jgi:hypothetical protein
LFLLCMYVCMYGRMDSIGCVVVLAHSHEAGGGMARVYVCLYDT